MKLNHVFALSLCFLGSLDALGDVSCPKVFSSHMVLQRGQAVPVWGEAAADEQVTVEFGGQSISTRTAANGRWKVMLSALEASRQPRTLTVRGSNELRFDDVLVGDVWLCSGQSNMEKPLGPRENQKPVDRSDEEIRRASHPDLRLYQVPRNGRSTPDDLSYQWGACTPERLAKMKFSACAYFFGRELQMKLAVPVGLIHTSYGGTRIELWTPPSAYKGMADLDTLVKAAATADRKIDDVRIGDLFDSMVQPMIPYGVRGVIWYQGESNLVSGDTVLYTRKMEALIGSWRAAWGMPKLPFYYVQLAPYAYSERKRKKPSDKLLTAAALPLFWEAQTAALALSDTGMAVITDTVADLSDIHPTNKQDVGARLARLALARAYGQKQVVDSGPVFIKGNILKNQVQLEFANAQGLASRDGNPLTGFMVAGDDRVFIPAVATIQGHKVILSAPGIAKPAAVRFAWDERANPNLVNAAGVPARSFRTDHWPVDAFVP